MQGKVRVSYRPIYTKMGIALAFLLTCCLLIGFGVLPGATAQQKVTLAVWDFISPEGFPEWVGILEKFEEEYPNIKLDRTMFDDQEIKTQVRVSAAGGIIGDAMNLYGGFPMQEHADEGLLMDLTDIVREQGWFERAAEAMWGPVTYKGRIWQVPSETLWCWMILFYNETILEDYGLVVPLTVGDMIQTSKKLPEDIAMLAFGNKDGWYATLESGEYVLQQVGPDFFDEIGSGEKKFNDPIMVKALDTLVTFAKEGVLNLGYNMLDHSEAISNFARGKAAAIQIGSWINIFRREFPPELKWAAAPLPVMEPRMTYKGYQLSPLANWCIGKETKHLKEAIQFVDYVISDEVAKQQAISQGGPAAWKCTQTPEMWTYYAPWYQAPFVRKQLEWGPLAQYFNHAVPAQVLSVWQKEVQLALAGKKTAEEALTVVEKESQMFHR